MSKDDVARLEKTVASSFGKGSITADDGKKYSFTMQGDVLEDESSYGKFRFYTFVGENKLDFNAEVTCAAIDSENRRIWVGGKIIGNNSKGDEFTSGQYAVGQYAFFRAQPNKISTDEIIPGAIEVPSFGGEQQANEFCASKAWSDAGLLKLTGANDLIAALP